MSEACVFPDCPYPCPQFTACKFRRIEQKVDAAEVCEIATLVGEPPEEKR